MTKAAHSIRFGTLAILALCGLAASPVAAVDVPEEVVLEILKVAPRWGNGDPSILIGGLPAEVGEGLGLPDSVRIVASVSWGDSTSLVGRTELSRSVALGQIGSALAESSWTLREAKVESQGFQPSRDDEAEVFCREDGKSLWVDVRDAKGDENAVHLSLGGSRNRFCRGADRYEAMMAMQHGDFPFPALFPPDGAKSSGAGGSSSGMNSAEQSTDVETEMTAGDLLVHYADQMAQAGWAPDAASEYRSVAYQSWILLDAEGTEWHGLLVVLPGGDEGRKQCSLRITRLGES